VRAGAQQRRGHVGAGGDEMLAVVQYQQQAAGLKGVGERG